MEKILKVNLMKEIIDLGIFVVIKSSNKNKWILLKDGSRTPIFLDTSKFISYPKLLKRISQYIIQEINSKNLKFDKIMGLPYGGLPFSYGVSNILEIPSLAVRKEGKKNYSTSGGLLGLFNKNEKILLIEDAIVTANTAIGFINRLKKDNLIVKDLITIVDTGAEGRENLEREGVKLHSIFTWEELSSVFDNR